MITDCVQFILLDLVLPLAGDELYLLLLPISGFRNRNEFGAMKNENDGQDLGLKMPNGKERRISRLLMSLPRLAILRSVCVLCQLTFSHVYPPLFAFLDIFQTK